MKLFFRIKRDTEPYAIAHKCYHYKDSWNNPEFEKEFESVIGVSADKNLMMWPHVLELATIPEGSRDQFKKRKTRNNAYQAKVNSYLNQKFKELVKKYRLVYCEMTELSVRMGYGYWSCVYPFCEATDFIMETKELSEESIEKLRIVVKEYAEEVPAKEFYTMMANKAEEDARNQNE